MHDYDTTLKFLSDRFPEHFANLVFEQFEGNVVLLDKELPTNMRKSDYVVKIENSNCYDGNFILHIEFQSSHDTDMPNRMLSYYTRIRDKYELPVYPVVVYLNPNDHGCNIQNSYENSIYGDDIIKFKYKVLKVWEIDPKTITDNNLYGLYPIIPLTKDRSTNDEKHLIKCFDLIQNIDIKDNILRSDISVCTSVLAGLKYPKELIKSLMKVEIMRESVIYQDILDEGMEKGMEKGLEKSIVSVLVARFGDIPANLTDVIYHTKNQSRLDKLLRLAATSTTVNEFEYMMQKA
ncbi:MAG: Rpn family recombination-promoting nuclease/putative transposase [Methanosarcinaceae archaeon]|nr:Rpn family recombination-promoting nuclease/putative transposase [Methanosarcinaceae archaeon]